MTASYILFYEVFCPDFLDHGRQMFLFKSELQWATKVLRHFRKMAPFAKWTYLSSYLVYPNPFPPKSTLYFGPSSLSFTSDNIDSGGERIYGLEKEWKDKWTWNELEMFDKSTRFKEVCQLLLSPIVVSVCSLAVFPQHLTISSKYHHHYHLHHHSAAVTETPVITLRQNSRSPKTVQRGQSNKT